MMSFFRSTIPNQHTMTDSANDFTVRVYKKPSSDSQVYFQAKKKDRNPNHGGSSDAVNIGNDILMDETVIDVDVDKGNTSTSHNDVALDIRRKRLKFISLSAAATADNDDSMHFELSGRHPCECQAVKHPLVNNCISCGKIVCEREGTGPCFFCGEDVYSKEQQDIRDRQSKKSRKLEKEMRKLRDNFDQGLERAIQQRNMLLTYDKNSTKRCKVIDDESDYFNISSWSSPEERAAAEKAQRSLEESRERAKHETRITIDIAGRCVIDESVFHDGSKAPANSVVSTESDYASMANDLLISDSKRLHNFVDGPLSVEDVPTNLLNPPPIYISSSGKIDAATSHIPARDVSSFLSPTSYSNSSTNRVQDASLQELSDSGMCLSMHQPWASLLVAGIKEVEGRSWYSSFRGRLWIASTAQEPSPEEITAVEQDTRLWRTLHESNKDVAEAFPKVYPTSCLLGCVIVRDVLSQNEYVQRFPDPAMRSSTSPYVFIVESPQQLLLCLPIRGQHKIYPLEAAIHRSALFGLLQRRQTLSVSQNISKTSEQTLDQRKDKLNYNKDNKDAKKYSFIESNRGKKRSTKMKH